ncbi:SRPBCC family protein [Streptomyces sp. NPDC097619]|uniref:SRPBCC family protein n=1 Tax=Streptomyces sp. NPDC097619 TaxID=3157228 RepID=UPI003317FBA3
MAFIRIVRTSPLTASGAWRCVTDWERHGALVPLTRTVLLTPPPTGPGSRFTARTGLGPAVFDDPMEVTVWRPPAGDAAGAAAGLVRLEKRGRWVTGWAEIGVLPVTGGCVVEWHEELRVRGVPRAGDPLLAGAGRAVFGRALTTLLRTP